MVLDMVETIMVARLGDEAKFTKLERDNIEPNAAAILSKMSPKTAKNIAKFSEPIAVATGVFMYSMRLAALSAKKNAEQHGVALNREYPARPGTATSRPPGSVVVPVATPSGPAHATATPVQNIPRNGTAPLPRDDVPKDGSGKVDAALSKDWGA
jgi:hypothetical protein